MKWLKNNLKFNTTLFWILILIIGIFLAHNKLGIVLFGYALIMLIGRCVENCGKYFEIDFTNRRWYLIGITMAILWFIVAIAEIVIEIKMMPAPEDLLHQIDILMYALTAIVLIAYIMDFITKPK